jgi:hypothetical protein
MSLDTTKSRASKCTGLNTVKTQYLRMNNGKSKVDTDNSSDVSEYTMQNCSIAEAMKQITHTFDWDRENRKNLLKTLM